MKFKNQLVLLTILISCHLCVNNLCAQSRSNYLEKDLKIVFTGEIGMASKKSNFNYGLGFNIAAQYLLSKELTAFSSIGYAKLLTKDTSPIPDYDFLPLLAGIKVFAIERIYLVSNVGTGIPIQNGSKLSLIYGGGGGYEFAKFDLSVMFNAYQQQKKSLNYQAGNGMFNLKLGFHL